MKEVKHGSGMDGVDANEEAYTHLAFNTKGKSESNIFEWFPCGGRLAGSEDSVQKG